MKLLRYGVVLLLCSVLGIGPVHAQDIPVSLPDLTGLSSGSSLTIPVKLDEAVSSSDQITAFEIAIQYDGSVIDITDVTSGDLTDGWTIQPNGGGTNEFVVEGIATAPLEGGPGNLVVLQADVLSSGSTALEFANFRFNEGEPSSSATDGNVSVDNLLVITEVHADPATASACGDFGKPDDCGDANGDGTTSSDDDEFVEIVNSAGDVVDVSDFTVSVNGVVEFPFPPGTTLSPGEAATIFGGGTPTGIPGQVFTTTSLNLDNDDGTVVLADADGNRVDAMTYGGEGTSNDAEDNQSLTRDPQFIDPFKKHTLAASGVLYSPGQSPDGSALPVELTRFDAVVKGGDVTLRWATASETNNSGFEVQRNVEGAFQRLGFVEGAGTTSRPQAYDYQVNGLSAGKHVFRLKQVDFDGSTSYSQAVEVLVSIDGRFEMDAAYPNPFHESATVGLRVKKTQDVSVALYNVLGQRVRDLYRGTMHPGDKRSFTIDGGGLPSGVYIYRIQGETFSEARQITHIE